MHGRDPVLVLPCPCSQRLDAPRCHGNVTVANATALTAAVAGTSSSSACLVLLAAHEYKLTAELQFARNVTVRAAAPGHEAILRAASGSRVLSVGKGVDVTLEGVRVSGGRVVGPACGGGILNEGRLTLIDCTLVDNRAVDGPKQNFGTGGGMCNKGGGDATLRDVTIVNNTANVRRRPTLAVWLRPTHRPTRAARRRPGMRRLGAVR